MIHPSKLSIVVVMVGETPYWPITRPIIESYCQRFGYEFTIHSRRQTPEPWHPSWDKLVAPRSASREHVLLWDADLVPLPFCPAIHFFLDPEKPGMAKVLPSRGGRQKLRRRYGRVAERFMHYNCGLISVPAGWRRFLRRLHTAENFETSIFWEQGIVNHAIYEQKIEIAELDPRWNTWVSGALGEELVDSSFCLHFAKGSSRRIKNIRRLRRILQARGQWVR